MPITESPPERIGVNPDRLLSYGEFAEWVGVPERTARQWVAAGDGPRVLRLGRHRRIRVADALAWLDSRYVNGAPRVSTAGSRE